MLCENCDCQKCKKAGQDAVSEDMLGEDRLNTKISCCPCRDPGNRSKAIHYVCQCTKCGHANFI